MGEDRIKVLLKVLDENIDSLVWEHVCYCSRDVYCKFLKTFHLERFELADYCVRWIKDDFHLDVPMTTVKDVQIMKELIHDRYKVVYPHIFQETKTGLDYQGWVRVWLTEHMKKEMRMMR